MKKLSLCLFVVLFAAIASADPVSAAWRARYNVLEKIFAAKDMAGLDAMCSKDLVWVQVDGTKKNRKETFAEFAGMFQAQKVTVHEKLLKIEKRGGVVDIYCEVFFNLVIPGKTDTKMHSLCVDSWKKIGGKWLLVKTVDTKVEISGGK